MSDDRKETDWTPSPIWEDNPDDPNFDGSSYSWYRVRLQELAQNPKGTVGLLPLFFGGYILFQMGIIQLFIAMIAGWFAMV